MRPRVVWREDDKSSFFRRHPFVHIQELGLPALCNVIEVEDVDPDASRVILITVFAMPHMIAPSRMGLLHLVGVNGMLRDDLAVETRVLRK